MLIDATAVAVATDTHIADPIIDGEVGEPALICESGSRGRPSPFEISICDVHSFAMNGTERKACSPPPESATPSGGSRKGSNEICLLGVLKPMSSLSRLLMLKRSGVAVRHPEGVMPKDDLLGVTKSSSVCVLCVRKWWQLCGLLVALN
jgi:hypothetical protein